MDDRSHSIPRPTAMMLETVERETGPRWSVIWLHGLGADGNDFVPIVPELVRRGLAGAALRVPARAGAAGDDQQRHAMRAWYDIVGMSFWPTAPTTAGVANRSQQVEALIAREHERGIEADAGRAGRLLAGRRDRAGHGAAPPASRWRA
jgi:phospholipase/carboxylesterase